MPESNVHKGDAELGGHQDHSHYHNVLPAKIWEFFSFNTHEIRYACIGLF